MELGGEKEGASSFAAETSNPAASESSLELAVVSPLPEASYDSPKHGFGPNGRNWKSKLFGQSSNVKANVKLRYFEPTLKDGIPVGVCPSSASEDNLKRLEDVLVGFFLGKRPSFQYVKSTLEKQWKCNGAVEFKLLHRGGFAFRFADSNDRTSVLEKGVFHVGGRPLFVQAWAKGFHAGNGGLKSVPLWVSLPGLPLHLWGEEALSRICSVLGKPLYSDRCTMLQERLVYARACVEFSGEKELRDQITILDEDGTEFTQSVVYDWKPPVCIACKVFGHASTACIARSAASQEVHDGNLAGKASVQPSSDEGASGPGLGETGRPDLIPCSATGLAELCKDTCGPGGAAGSVFSEPVDTGADPTLDNFVSPKDKQLANRHVSGKVSSAASALSHSHEDQNPFDILAGISDKLETPVAQPVPFADMLPSGPPVAKSPGTLRSKFILLSRGPNGRTSSMLSP